MKTQAQSPSRGVLVGLGLLTAAALGVQAWQVVQSLGSTLRLWL